MYWQEELETMSRENLEKLQLARLKKTVEAAAHSPFYNKVFKEHSITADSIQSLDDLKKIPFTTKQDLRDNYPFGLVAIPLRECVRLHSSSGTTGNPTVVLHSKKDLDEWANQVARCMYMVGLRDTDVRVGEPSGPLHVYGRAQGYGRFPEHVGLRHVHRWIGLPIRSGAARRADRPGGGGKHQTADQIHHRFRYDLPAHHPKLRDPPGGGHVRDGYRSPQGHEVAHRLYRCRTTFRRAA